MTEQDLLVQKKAEALAAQTNADIFLFSGSINRRTAEALCSLVRPIKVRRENVTLILTTNGGDPDAAFLIARAMKRHYKKFTLIIFGLCKSAGTLVAIGADQIVMSDRGELGPLDIQLGKDDELFRRGSGLDLSESIKFLKQLSWDLFMTSFVQLKQGTTITTKTAAEIAQSLAFGIVEPIASQIDPIRLGEVQRAMRIAKDYGKLLNEEFANFDKLVTSYPSHSFVIDRDEAKNVFKDVRAASEIELELQEALGDCVLASTNEVQVAYLTPVPAPVPVAKPDKVPAPVENKSKPEPVAADNKEVQIPAPTITKGSRIAADSGSSKSPRVPTIGEMGKGRTEKVKP